MHRFILSLLSVFAGLAISISDPPIALAEPGSFCKNNPKARICVSGPEVARQEKAVLEEECRWRPNTEKCKEKATREKVRKERYEYCDKNPKACAARRPR